MRNESLIDPSIPNSLQEIVARELEPGERLEWIGMPRPVFFTPMATGAFLFGIPCLARLRRGPAGRGTGLPAGRRRQGALKNSPADAPFGARHKWAASSAFKSFRSGWRFPVKQ
jgi:hypothetical protein